MPNDGKAGERVSIALLVDAGTGSDDASRFLNALIDLCNHKALGTQPDEKIAALEYILAIERSRK